MNEGMRVSTASELASLALIILLGIMQVSSERSSLLYKKHNNQINNAVEVSKINAYCDNCTVTNTLEQLHCSDYTITIAK